ncbi:MAG: phosphodiester glycosidase family protein [Bacteroidales bacterium]
MKSINLLFLALSLMLVSLNLSMSHAVTIQEVEFTVDTLRHVKVGPGTTYTKLRYSEIESTRAFNTHLLTMDVNNESVKFKMEVGNDSVHTVEEVSEAAKRKTAPGSYYFAAVNADFYHTSSPYTGIPNAACYMDGEIASTSRSESSQYGHLYIDYDKYMWCDYPSQSYNFTVGSDTETHTISRINYDVYDNEIVLFNSKYGTYTKTTTGTEIAVKLVDGEKWSVNKSFKAEVIGTYQEGGNMVIPDGCAVLSARGTRVEDITSLVEGDILTFNFNVKLVEYNITPLISECAGGDVVILKRGEVVYDAVRWINGRDNDNPRTMLGYNEDRTKMVWGLIDGRSSESAGSTYPEGAEVMALAGCYEAVNVDGGGSSNMYVQNIGIMNSPSDGKERAVSNGIYAVLDAPEDNVIAEIQFIDYAMLLPKYGIYKPIFYGYNQYGMLIDTDVQGVTLSASEDIGIIQDGDTFIGYGDGTGALVASLGDITTSIALTVDQDSEMNFRLEKIVTDTYKDYTVEVESEVNGEVISVDSSVMDWSSEDEQIVTIDSQSGKLRGVSNGTTKVYGTCESFSGELEVTVEKPESHIMPIDPNLDVTSWTLAQVGGSNIAMEAYENGAKISYTGASGRSSYIRLTKSLQLWSLPDSIQIRINPYDAPVTGITITTATAAGAIASNVLDVDIVANEINTIKLATADWCDASDMQNYPITITQIQLSMGTSTTGIEYIVEIPGIETVYSEIPVSSVESVLVNKSQSLNIYPNPVNRGQVIYINNLNEQSTLYIYNALSKLVNHITSDGISDISIDTSTMDAGVHFIKADLANGESKLGKVIIK